MRLAVLGATRGLGRALARRAAARGDDLFLLGRDPDALARSAADLEARGAAGPVRCATVDLREPGGFAAALEAAGDRDAVAITAGVFATERELAERPAGRAELLAVNHAGTVLFCELAGERLAARGGGTLCVFGSIAGDRIRPSLATYAASKAALAASLDALELRLRPRGVRVVLVKPGFARTDMTEGLSEPPFAADADEVARIALHALDRGSRVAYAPRIGRLLSLVLRCLPRPLLRRMRS